MATVNYTAAMLYVTMLSLLNVIVSSVSRPRNDPLCVEWDVKPYTLTHSVSTNVHIYGYHFVVDICGLPVLDHF